MGNAVLISFFLAVALLLINGALPFPTETSSMLPPKISNQKSSDVRDSPLEHIHVKQETGFDGKVRSIRFSLEPENDKNPDEKRTRTHVTNRPKHKSEVTTTTATVTLSSNIETDVDGTKTTLKPEVPPSRSTRMVRVDETLPVNGNLLRSRRSIEPALSNNDLDDLQAEEAKVFRPLFVYRQQVSRRLKLQNDKISGGDRRRTLRKSNNYGNLR